MGDALWRKPQYDVGSPFHNLHYSRKALNMKRSGRLKSILLVYVTIVCTGSFFFMLGGCARTRQARPVGMNNSGFLPDYSLLKPGQPGRALLRYQNPNTEWPSYEKILLDPVLIWSRTGNPPEATTRKDLQRLVNNLDQMLNMEFGKDYEIVEEPGPQTLRIQVALTNIEQSAGAVDVITAERPVGHTMTGAQEFVTGKPLLVGEVKAEIKVSDARTGQILLMAVDRKLGSKTIQKSIDTWDDADQLLKLLASFGRFRLCKLRGGSDCFNPLD